MPTLVIKNPDGTEREQSWAGGLTIGRAETNDLVLVADGVAAEHARLWEEAGVVEIEDAGSESGTFVDGRRIGGRVQLKPQATVIVGKVQILLKKDASEKSNPTVVPDGPRPTRSVARVRPLLASELARRPRSPSLPPKATS